MKYFIGIDIGSSGTKTIVMDENSRIIYRLLRPTGWSSVDTAEAVKQELLTLGISLDDSYIVASGYGRISVPFADATVTEISCHAYGASYLFDKKDLTVIDIGGQDTKTIQLQNSMVVDFIMNDKCSAGTGRFLEVMANTLSMSPRQLDDMAAKGSSTSISSMCTVFAESEVISLIGRGEKRENIAFAVIDSIIKKVSAQVRRLKPDDSSLCLTGGLCDFKYLRQGLSADLGRELLTHEDGRHAGAIGAALVARQKSGVFV